MFTSILDTIALLLGGIAILFLLLTTAVVIVMKDKISK